MEVRAVRTVGLKTHIPFGPAVTHLSLVAGASPSEAGACPAMPWLTRAITPAGSAATSPQLLLNTGGCLHLLTLATGSLQYEDEVRCAVLLASAQPSDRRHDLPFATGSNRHTGGSSHRHWGRDCVDARQVRAAQRHLHGCEGRHHAG